MRRLLLIGVASILVGANLSSASDPQFEQHLTGPTQFGAPPPDDRLTVPKTAVTDDESFFDLCVQGAMNRHDTPGAALAVFKDGAMIYEKGYGVKHRHRTDSVTAQTYFRIGSVTKQLTAAAVMQQVELGTVGLKDRVTEHIPELQLRGWWPASDIRIYHLLTHTSGYPDNFMSIDSGTAPEALEQWAAEQGYARLHAPPGSFWNYSNPNFSLAGLVVERASGVRYREYMEREIFDAAGLERTTFDPATVMADGDWTWGHYISTPGAAEMFYQPDSYDHVAFSPAGYAFSTAGDLVRWADLLMRGGGAVLSASSAAAMQAPHVGIETAPGSSYGYGIIHENYEGVELMSHGGNIPGWGAYLVWVPEYQLGIAVLANTFESLGEAAYCIVDSVYRPPGGEEINTDPDRDKWDSFIGTYSGFNAIGVAMHADIYWDDGILTADLVNSHQPADHVESRLIPALLDTFLMDLDGDGVGDLDLTFHTSDGDPGRVEWLVNRQWVGAKDVNPRRGNTRSGSN